MQRYDHQPSKSYNTTFALAQFLTTTGPEDYSNYGGNRVSQYDNGISFDPQTSHSLQTSKVKFFDRIRKKANNNNLKFIQQQEQQKLYQHHFPHHNKSPLSGYGSPSSPVNKGTVHKKHIPLIDDINQPKPQLNNYHNHHQQQISPFYETEDNSFNNAGDTLPSFPTPPASSLHESEENHQQAPSPLYSSPSSSSISESSPAYTPAHITRSKTATVAVNRCHKKGVRRGSRHIQVQTEGDGDCFLKKEDSSSSPASDHPLSSDSQVTAVAAETIHHHHYHQEEQQQDQNGKDRCDLCCRPYNQQHLKFRRRDRRTSCPAAMASGAKIKIMGHEAGVLLALIDQLKQQLVEEQQSRKLLEKAIQSQWLEKTNTFA